MIDHVNVFVILLKRRHDTVQHVVGIWPGLQQHDRPKRSPFALHGDRRFVLIHLLVQFPARRKSKSNLVLIVDGKGNARCLRTAPPITVVIVIMVMVMVMEMMLLVQNEFPSFQPVIDERCCRLEPSMKSTLAVTIATEEVNPDPEKPTERNSITRL